MRKGSHIFALVILLLLSMAGCSQEGEQGPRLLKEGEKAPDFLLPSLEGKKVSLKDMAGKKTLIVFWATWCPSCKEELKSLDRTYRKYKDMGFNILAINIYDSKKMVEGYVKRYDLTFPVLLDREGDVAERYLVFAIPIAYMVDERGIIRERFIGGLPERDVMDLLREYWSIEGADGKA